LQPRYVNSEAFGGCDFVVDIHAGPIEPHEFRLSAVMMVTRSAMISNRICAFAFSAALLIICPIQPAFAAQSDGSWKMVLKTTNTAIAA